MSEEAVQSQEVVEEGAPDWVVTFGDMMSLLMCFFVLLLSFSEMDRAKYKEVAGSLEKAFGIQRQIKATDSPKGIKMIAKDFDQEAIPTRQSLEFVATQQREELGEELKREVETRFQGMNDMIQVEVNESQVIVRMMGDTAFDSGKAELRKQMIPLLKNIGASVIETKGDLIIAGHTDNVPMKGGLYKSNLRLSIARATSVAEFLIHQTTIDPQRISTMGFGEFRPIESNVTPEGRMKNRRVEIILGNFGFLSRH